MAKQLLDAQVMYFLEKNKFFPEDGATIDVSTTVPRTMHRSPGSRPP